MARYWASKPSLPSASAEEKSTGEYQKLSELSEALRGITIDQGAPDIVGGFEMICALQFHYMNFVRIIDRKIERLIPHDTPDERFEAVAYIGRVGQFDYFTKSAFVAKLRGTDDFEGLTWAAYLLPFRHKYSAHRDRDKPKKGEEGSLSGELSLGALGGHLFTQKSAGAIPHQAAPYDREAEGARQYEWSNPAYEIPGTSKLFIPQLHHPYLIDEFIQFMSWLIQAAKALPRE